MKKKLLTAVLLVFAFATVVAPQASPAEFPPPSPGACNMMHTSANGMDGMAKASDRGLGNMMALVAASCPP